MAEIIYMHTRRAEYQAYSALTRGMKQDSYHSITPKHLMVLYNELNVSDSLSHIPLFDALTTNWIEELTDNSEYDFALHRKDFAGTTRYIARDSREHITLSFDLHDVTGFYGTEFKSSMNFHIYDQDDPMNSGTLGIAQRVARNFVHYAIYQEFADIKAHAKEELEMQLAAHAERDIAPRDLVLDEMVQFYGLHHLR